MNTMSELGATPSWTYQSNANYRSHHRPAENVLHEATVKTTGAKHGMQRQFKTNFSFTYLGSEARQFDHPHFVSDCRLCGNSPKHTAASLRSFRTVSLKIGMRLSLRASERGRSRALGFEIDDRDVLTLWDSCQCRRWYQILEDSFAHTPDLEVLTPLIQGEAGDIASSMSYTFSGHHFG